MPQVRRKNVPPALLRHLLERIQERRIDARQLQLLAEWLDAEPEVPDGPLVQTVLGDDRLCLR